MDDVISHGKIKINLSVLFKVENLLMINCTLKEHRGGIKNQSKG